VNQRSALELSWQPEQADFTEAFHARNRARKAWRKIWTLSTVGLLLAMVFTFLTAPQGLVFFCVFFAVAFPVSALIMQPISVRGYWRRNPALHDPLRATVDPLAGITLTGQSSGTHPWSVVHDFLETDRVFVVQLSGYRNLGFLLLAKRGLPDSSDVDTLRDMLSDRTYDQAHR
jgi:hypothetical protein